MLPRCMLTTAVVMLLCASPVRIAATSFTVHGDDQARADAWLDRFAEVMRQEPGLEVTTPSQVAQLLGMERQRQMLGCTQDSTECFAELAAALGAEGILSGTVTKSGDSYLAVLRLVRQSTGKVWWSATTRVKGEGALLDWLDAQAPLVVEAVLPRKKTGPPVAPLVVGGLGVVAAGVGAGFLVVSNAVTLPSLRTATSSEAIANLSSAGKGETTMAAVFLGAGAVTIGAAALWLALTPKQAPAVALVPVEGGAVASLGGRW